MAETELHIKLHDFEKLFNQKRKNGKPAHYEKIRAKKKTKVTPSNGGQKSEKDKAECIEMDSAITKSVPPVEVPDARPTPKTRPSTATTPKPKVQPPKKTKSLPEVQIEIDNSSTPSPMATPVVQVVKVDIEHVSSLSYASSDKSGSILSGSGSFTDGPAKHILRLPSTDQQDSLSVASSLSFRSTASSRSSIASVLVQERLKSLRDDIRRRTSLVKAHVSRVPSPTDSIISTLPTNDEEREKRNSLSAFVALDDVSMKGGPGPTDGDTTRPIWKKLIAMPFVNRFLPRIVDKRSKGYLLWLAVVTSCFLYNAFGIPLRSAYPYQTKDNIVFWLIADYLCDFIYLVDATLVKPRITFMREGLPVRDSKVLAKKYLGGVQFKLDLLALLPLDFVYFKIGVKPFLRFPRLLKLLSYWEFFNLLDRLLSNPIVLRIGRTMSYMFYMIHCNSCVYYSLSAWQVFGKIGYNVNGKKEENKWVFIQPDPTDQPHFMEGPTFLTPYIRCFYFTTKLATSIGNNPSPRNVIEFIYMAVSWMLGVFVFALLLGQIRDIVATASRNREYFRNKMDTAIAHCRRLNVPKDIENRVRDWFMYTWQQQKTLDENRLIEKLPLKLQTDLAISVHYQILSKVQLFQDCEIGLLRDLVLKLRSVLFLPGDFICMKGEVGKEMYIVSKGLLEVVGGEKNEKVFATLKEGTVFGEISLLAIGGGNRRTANVRSKGFSNLFVLSKVDLNDTIQDYPDAQKVLKQKAKKMLKKDEQKKEAPTEKKEDIATVCKIAPAAAPKMMDTVVQILGPESKAAQTIKERIDMENEVLENREKDDMASVASLKEGQFLISTPRMDDVDVDEPEELTPEINEQEQANSTVEIETPLEENDEAENATVENVEEKKTD